MKGYNDLKIVKIVCALGTIPKKLEQQLIDTGIETSGIVELPKTTILYSAKILLI